MPIFLSFSGNPRYEPGCHRVLLSLITLQESVYYHLAILLLQPQLSTGTPVVGPNGSLRPGNGTGTAPHGTGRDAPTGMMSG